MHIWSGVMSRRQKLCDLAHDRPSWFQVTNKIHCQGFGLKLGNGLRCQRSLRAKSQGFGEWSSG